jgi:hypothetical protein
MGHYQIYYVDHFSQIILSIGKFLKMTSKIERFLTSEGEFTDRKIDWDGLDGIFEVVDLGDNEKIPKGLIPFKNF